MSWKLSACVLAVCAGTAMAIEVDEAREGWGKLKPDLKAVVSGAAEGELIPTVFVLNAQVSKRALGQAAAELDKEARRQAVVSQLKQTASASQAGLLDALEAGQAAGEVGAVRALWLHNAVVAEVSPELVVELASREEVGYANLDHVIGEEVFPVKPGDGNIPEGGVVECGVALMGTESVWAQGITGKDVVVGHIDTGVCTSHPDIVNQIWENPGEVPGNGFDDDGNGFVDDINGWNFFQNTNNVQDQNGHGTHTAGTVAGDGTNGQQTGMAPDAEVMVLEFWNNFAGESIVWECMQYAVDNGADVITASIGWPHSQNPDRAMWRNVSENTMAAGVVTIYAAGNEGACCGVDSVRTPGDVPDMITVGATTCSDTLAGFSSQGPVTWQDVPPFNDWPFPPGKLKPTISAPGNNTLSLSNNCFSYTTLSGTSMATPHVAGAVALMLEANPSLDHFQVKQILKDTSVDLGSSGADNQFGAGRVDAEAAVAAALDMADPCEIADFNADGDVNISDFIDFIAAFDAKEDSADLNGDGAWDLADIMIIRSSFVECVN